MARQKTQEAPTDFVTYPGPHAQVTLKNVGELGDVTFVRGVATNVGGAAAADLIQRKKARASTPEEINPPAAPATDQPQTTTTTEGNAP